MKYLKYYLVLIVVIIGVLVSGDREVNAFGLGFDFGPLSPRFQYLLDENDIIIPFEFELLEIFDSLELAENNDYILNLNQVTYEGYYIKRLEVFRPEFNVYSSDIQYLILTQTALSPSYTDSEFIVLYGLDFIDISSISVNSIVLSETDYNVGFNDDLGEYVIGFVASASILGDTIDITYTKEASTDYVAELYYDWSGLQWGEGTNVNVLFYQLRLDGLVIWSGAVMRHPHDNYLDYDVYGIEIGEFLIVGDGTVDSEVGGFTDQSQFTSYGDDRYIILHYRLPSTLVYPNFMSIRVTDIINNTLVDVFTTEDLLQVQGGNSINFYNSFIIIPIDNTISEGLWIEYPISYNDDYDLLLDEDYTEGSYYFAIDDGGTLLDGASVVWNIVEGDKDPFELYLSHYELNLNSLQRAIFYKNSSLIYDGYTTVLAKDVDVGDSYIDQINESNITYSAQYYPDSDLLEGDSSYFTWRVQPLFMPYSLDVADFSINMKQIYIYGEERGVEADIESLRTIFGMSDEAGGIFISIFTLMFINLGLLFITRVTFIYAVTNVVVVSVLAFFSLIPIWFIMAVILLSALGIKLSSGGAESYE